MWRTILNQLLDLVLPRACAGCRRGGAYLCENCLAQAPPAEPIPEPDAYATFDYEHPPLRRAIWLLKYKGVRELAKVFADQMYDRWAEELADIGYLEAKAEKRFLVVAIPSSAAHYKERGYNHAEWLATCFARHDRAGLEYRSKVLNKMRETPTQVSQPNRRARLENLRGAYRASGAAAGRNIIVIDDVITTGATMREARRALRAAGAGQVIALAVAHG